MRYITKKVKWLNEKDLQEHFLIMGELALDLVNEGLNDIKTPFDIKKRSLIEQEKDNKIERICSKCVTKLAEKYAYSIPHKLYKFSGLKKIIKNEQGVLKHEIIFYIESGALYTEITHQCDCGEYSVFDDNSGLDKSFVYKCRIMIPLYSVDKNTSIHELLYGVQLDTVKKPNNLGEHKNLTYKGKDYAMASIFNLFKST